MEEEIDKLREQEQPINSQPISSNPIQDFNELSLADIRITSTTASLSDCCGIAKAILTDRTLNRYLRQDIPKKRIRDSLLNSGIG